MICKCCGVKAPTKYVEFYQNIGAFFVRHHKAVKGNLCKSCINKYFWEFTLINLTLGWWGTISFFITPFLILNNLIRYLGTLKLKGVSNSTTARFEGERRSNSTDRSSVSSKPPARERDRTWFNTSDDRSSLPQEAGPSGDSSIEDLIKYLQYGNNLEFRRLAAELLGHRGSTAASAISALLIACVDIEVTVRKVALNALESIEPNWPQNPEVQKAFPKLTEEFKNSYCFKKSYSKDVSEAAYKLLKQIGEPAVSSLANLIVEEEDKIEYKICAIWILRDLGPTAASAMPQLIQALSNKASKVRIAAADALVNFGSVAKVAIPKLIVGLADRDIDVRKAMVACLVATEPAVPDLLPLLVDKNSNVRESVTDVLIQIGPKTVSALIATVSQWCTKSKTNINSFRKYQEITEAALQVLGKFGSNASVAVPTIALALVYPLPNIKFAAVHALGNIDQNWVSNSNVVNAIVNFVGTKVAISELTVGLADRDESVRKAMVACLAQFGSSAKSVVPQLLLLLTDMDHQVREAATDALRKIDPNTLPKVVERHQSPLSRDMDHQVRNATTDDRKKIDPPTQPRVVERYQTPSSRDNFGSFFKPSAASQPVRSPSKSSSQLHSLTQQLMKLLQGDSKVCQRLIELERAKNPQRSEKELYETVIYQLERDRK
jgi:HEAT repeat protein